MRADHPEIMSAAVDPIAEAANDRRSPESRRSILGRGLATAAAGAAGSLLLGSATSEAQGATSAAPPSLYNGWVRRNFVEIRTNENSHLGIVITAIRSLGGTPRPKPTFQGLVAANQLQFAEMSSNFENLGAAAYFGGGPYIFNPAVAAVASSLGLVEAYQSGFLNTLLNKPIVQNASTYQVPATPAQADAIAGQYIVSLNDNGLFPPTYAMTKSPENDIAILNFALILEYLETEFYNTNLPRLFPGT